MKAKHEQILEKFILHLPLGQVFLTWFYFRKVEFRLITRQEIVILFVMMLLMIPSLGHAATIDATNSADVTLLVGCVIAFGLGVVVGK